MELGDYLQSAKKSLFRFEYLQDFNVPAEESLVQRWKETGEIDTSVMQEWWEFVAEKTKSGVRMQRVRLVRFPLTDYTKMELAVFAETQKYGDEIRVLPEKAFHGLDIDVRDFWLIDDVIALEMLYSEKGEYLGCIERTDISSYVTARMGLMKSSVLLSKFSYEHLI